MFVRSMTEIIMLMYFGYFRDLGSPEDNVLIHRDKSKQTKTVSLKKF